MVGTIPADAAFEEKLGGSIPPAPPGGPPRDDEGSQPDSSPRGEPGKRPVGNAFIGLAMFLGAEAMFFAGLIAAFLFFRYGSLVWPPPFQPRLPLGVTWANTGVLLLSALTMLLAWMAWKKRDRKRLIRHLIITSVLGGVFLAVQGSEWARLIHFGLTISSGVYGATFYTLIGFHGLHVIGAVIWLVSVSVMLRRAPFAPRFRIRLELCAIYWYFVVGLWPVLFGLVYLS